MHSRDKRPTPLDGDPFAAVLMQATQEWRETLDALRDAVCLLDLHGFVLRCNLSMQQFINLPFEQIIGKSCWSLVYGQETPPDAFGRADRYGQLREYREIHFTRQLADRWCDIALVPVRSDDGVVAGAVHVIADITDIRHAERDLKQYADRLNLLHQIDRSVLELQPPEKMIQDVLRQLDRLAPFVVASVTLFDYQHQDAVLYAVMNDHPGKTEGGRVALNSAWVACLRSGNTCSVPDTRLLLPPAKWEQTAERLGIGETVSVPLQAGRELIGALNLGVAQDSVLTAERREIIHQVSVSLAVAIQNSRLFTSVNEQRGLLRSLALRMMSVEEDQRQRLAQELHDRVGQILTAIGINLTYVRGMLEGPPLSLLARLDESLSEVEQVSDRIRDVMSELRPMVLDDYGLPGALQWYGEQFTRRTAIKVVIEEIGVPRRLPREIETALYRIAEESFTNISKHSRAYGVTVTLESSQTGYRLEISDNGLGFDPQSVSSRSGKGGWGLMSMKERATGIGATLQVKSGIGKGTTVLIQGETGTLEMVPDGLGEASVNMPESGV